MSAIVRLFTFSGLMTAPVSAGSKNYSTDSVGLLKFPYVAREAITANTGAAQASASALSPDGVQVLFMQVASGKAVHVEINSPQRSEAADSQSPVFTGDQIFRFGAGWTISVLEHEVG